MRTPQCWTEEKQVGRRRIRRSSMLAVLVVAVGSLSTLLPACAQHGVAAIAPESRAVVRPAPPGPSEIRARTERSFAKAILLKPREDDGEESLRSLAPLFMVELPKDAPSDPADYLEYAPKYLRSMTASIESTSVYVDRSSTSIRGQSYDQLLYTFWRWVVTGSGEEFRRQTLCGLRATLGADGFPLTWEVLDDDGLDTIYVSRRLEDDSRRRFGDPLPGRSFAAERGVDDAARTVVARVLEDGPIPMGVYLYLRDGDHAASTLLCRCSPAQVDEVVFTKVYFLHPVESLGPEWRALLAGTDVGPLDVRLRWPYP